MGVISGVYWDYIGIMENKMETTIMAYIGIVLIVLIAQNPLGARAPKWVCLFSSNTSATMKCSVGPAQSWQLGLLHRLVSCAAFENARLRSPGSLAETNHLVPIENAPAAETSRFRVQGSGFRD